VQGLLGNTIETHRARVEFYGNGRVDAAPEVRTMREQEIRRWVRNGERVAEVREAWVKIFHYLGFGGFHAGGQYERFDERFGP